MNSLYFFFNYIGVRDHIKVCHKCCKKWSYVAVKCEGNKNEFFCKDCKTDNSNDNDSNDDTNKTIPASSIKRFSRDSDEEIEIGLKHNIACFNVESAQELEVLNQLAIKMGIKANVAIRVNPNIDVDTHQYITTGKYENKFGISHEYLIV